MPTQRSVSASSKWLSPVWIAGLRIETPAWYTQAATPLYLPVHTCSSKIGNWWLWLLTSDLLILLYRNSIAAKLVEAGSRTRSNFQLWQLETGKMLKIFPTGLLEELHYRVTVDFSCMIRNQTSATFGCFSFSCLSLSLELSFPISNAKPRCFKVSCYLSKCAPVRSMLYFPPFNFEIVRAEPLCILSTTRRSSSLHRKGFL